MEEFILEEWLQVLRNEDFISYLQFDTALKKVNMLEYEEAKSETLNYIRNNNVLTELEKAEKLYSYIKENYIKGNTLLSYKEILCN